MDKRFEELGYGVAVGGWNEKDKQLNKNL